MKKNMFLFALLILFANSLFSQVPWDRFQNTCVDQEKYDLNRYTKGHVFVNFPGDQTPNLCDLIPFLAPTLLIHGYKRDLNGVPYMGSYVNPVIRLQSGSYGDNRAENFYKESRLEFWNSNYQSPTQWQIGKIQSIYTGTLNTTDNSILTPAGGLAFYSSAIYPTQLPTNNGAQEVFRIANGKFGIGLKNDEIPNAIFDINYVEPILSPNYLVKFSIKIFHQIIW